MPMRGELSSSAMRTGWEARGIEFSWRLISESFANPDVLLVLAFAVLGLLLAGSLTLLFPLPDTWRDGNTHGNGHHNAGFGGTADGGRHTAGSSNYGAAIPMKVLQAYSGGKTQTVWTGTIRQLLHGLFGISQQAAPTSAWLRRK
jgi:hypothetical protein